MVYEYLIGSKLSHTRHPPRPPTPQTVAVLGRQPSQTDPILTGITHKICTRLFLVVIFPIYLLHTSTLLWLRSNIELMVVVTMPRRLLHPIHPSFQERLDKLFPMGLLYLNMRSHWASLLEIDIQRLAEPQDHD